MSATKELEKHRNFYRAAWVGRAGATEELLLKHGFGRGQLEIGNQHGEVHAYAEEALREATGLFRLMLAPTWTGKQGIKFDFIKQSRCRGFETRIKAAGLGPKIGQVAKNEWDRFEVSYLLFNQEIETSPQAAGDLLLQSLNPWLEELEDFAARA